MQRLTLTARITFEGDLYTAQVDQLPIEASGISTEQAQDELTDAVRAWIQVQDSSDALAISLSAAGFHGVTEDTEIELEFVD